MNDVGLTTVGKLLGHRRRGTTAIYAHLDDAALQEAAAQAAAVIARAMGYRSGAPAAATTAHTSDDWTLEPGPTRRAEPTSRPACAADVAEACGAPSPAVTAMEEPDRSHRRWVLSSILRQKR
ncbi:MAG: hypothetical protein OXF33_00910 [Rhodospirillales bacterium]|nr:hypothetical protein [Rhodospirillales bacterium]